MADIVKDILISAIELTVQVVKASDFVIAFKNECDEVKIKVEKLSGLLKRAVIGSSSLCEFPTRYIITKVETLLHKCLSLFHKCEPCVFCIVSASTFQKMMVVLEDSINDFSWLLNVSIPSENDGQGYFLLPPSGINDPVLFLIYQQMAILYTGPLDDSCDAAQSLGSLASGSPRYADIMISNGLCSIIVKILKEGPMRAQVEVACTISLLVASFPESQNVFAQHDMIHLLLSHLISGKTFELEDSLKMKIMAAKALRELAKGNSTVCKSITGSKRFLRFADSLEIEDKEVRYNSLMVLIEITAVAEQDSDLRHSAFKSTSPVFKAIVNQMGKLMEENGDTVLLIPYITLIGNLARAFKASNTSIIEHLVKLLDHQDPEVSTEAIVALTKFASPWNYLHKDHSKAIVEAGAARKLIELSSSLGCEVRIPALELLIHIAVHVPEKEEVMKVMECASKQPLIK